MIKELFQYAKFRKKWYLLPLIFALIIFPFYGTALAAIAPDAATNGGSTTATSLTFAATATTTANSIMLFEVTGNNVLANDYISGAAFNGDAATIVKKYYARGRWRYAFELKNPDAGTHNVVISASASTFIRANVVTYTGVDQTTNPEVSATSTQPANINEAVSINTITDNAWVVLFAFAHSVSAGVDTTLRVNNTGDAILDSGGPVSPAGSKTLNAVDDEGLSEWANIIMVLKPAAEAPVAADVSRSRLILW